MSIMSGLLSRVGNRSQAGPRVFSSVLSTGSRKLLSPTTAAALPAFTALAALANNSICHPDSSAFAFSALKSRIGYMSPLPALLWRPGLLRVARRIRIAPRHNYRPRLLLRDILPMLCARFTLPPRVFPLMREVCRLALMFAIRMFSVSRCGVSSFAASRRSTAWLSCHATESACYCCGSRVPLLLWCSTRAASLRLALLRDV